MIVGTTTPLAAVIRDYYGVLVARTPKWTSLDTTIATIDTSGSVQALQVGSVIVTSGIGEMLDSVTVTVILIPVKTVNVTVPPSLVIGATAQAIASALDSTSAQLTGRPVAWSSRSSSVASVSSTGVITGVSTGTAIIDAVVGGVTGSDTVSVVVPPVHTVKTVATSLLAPSLIAGATTQAFAVLLDSVGVPITGPTTSWSSSNAAVATVSSIGLVTSFNAGTATITATSNGKTGSTTLSVTTPTALYPEVLAALPNVYLNTTAPVAPASGGVVINVAAGGNLQAAINQAKPGDVIALANGAVFTGNFLLPSKNTSSTSWITIRPQSMAGIPAEGSRMTKTVAAAAHLPIIQTTNGSGAIATQAYAHHYRLIGLEVTVVAGSPENYGLVLLGDGGAAQNSLALVPHDLVLDRMYIHGTSTNEVRRCLALNAASAAIVDSYLSDCHESNSDSQAIMGWNGPGPFKIVNNYVEGSAENILFGGADPQIQNLIPSDIEIRHNHITKPASWKTDKWIVKNLFETKNAQRVLVEGNLLENNWASGQTGVAVALKSVNQSNTCPWCSSQDITMRYNIIRNVGGGFSLAGAPDNLYQTNVHGRRFTLLNNVITGINVGIFNGDGDGFQLNDDITDITIAHNTVITPTHSSLVFNGPRPTVRLSARDNILGGGSYPLQGRATGSGLLTLTTFMPGGNFSYNALVLPSAQGYPLANYYPYSIAAIGFVNSSTDFHLASNSPLKNKASDGRDLGADIDTVNALTANVIVP